MTDTLYRHEDAAETAASLAALWRLFADVPGWTSWNAGIETILIDGPFAAGTTFRMQPPGQEMFISTLVEVTPYKCFVDETVVGDLTVRVTHRLEPVDASPGLVRVVYAIEAKGPGAAEIGPMICADFPEVIAALIARAEAEVGTVL